MQKQAPSVGRILTMVVFALSCFGLLLFLWLSFGGAIPLQPQKYRFKVPVPEATQLGIEADVRTAGVTVGKVTAKSTDPRYPNRTVATVDLIKRFAPIRSNAHAILRQKTLLGETYLELTPGTRDAKPVPDNGLLAPAQVRPTVELDEIFNALDPTTRQAFRTWQQSLAKGVANRGQDLNDALGNLPPFAADTTDVLNVLNSQSAAVRRLFSNTGVVFNALTQRRGQLRDVIVNSEQVFSATAAQNQSLAETFRIFPTFLDQSKLTLARLETFARDTDPLIRDLRPATRDLVPTLRSVRLLAPDLRRLFINLDPLIRISKRGLPALSQILRGAKPLLAQLGPFLQQLNPVLEYLEQNQPAISDFFSNGITGVADTTGTATPGAIGHYLRQFGPTGVESLGAFQTRLPTNRGNAYIAGTDLSGDKASTYQIFPNFDCNTTGRGETLRQDGPGGFPGCFVAPKRRLNNKATAPTTFPEVGPADYSAGTR